MVKQRKKLMLFVETHFSETDSYCFGGQVHNEMGIQSLKAKHPGLQQGKHYQQAEGVTPPLCWWSHTRDAASSSELLGTRDGHNQQRATKVLKGPEYVLHEVKLRELGWEK